MDVRSGSIRFSHCVHRWHLFGLRLLLLPETCGPCRGLVCPHFLYGGSANCREPACRVTRSAVPASPKLCEPPAQKFSSSITSAMYILLVKARERPSGEGTMEEIHPAPPGISYKIFRLPFASTEKSESDK